MLSSICDCYAPSCSKHRSCTHKSKQTHLTHRLRFAPKGHNVRATACSVLSTFGAKDKKMHGTCDGVFASICEAPLVPRKVLRAHTNRKFVCALKTICVCTTRRCTANDFCCNRCTARKVKKFYTPNCFINLRFVLLCYTFCPVVELCPKHPFSD